MASVKRPLSRSSDDGSGEGGENKRPCSSDRVASSSAPSEAWITSPHQQLANFRIPKKGPSPEKVPKEGAAQSASNEAPGGQAQASQWSGGSDHVYFLPAPPGGLTLGPGSVLVTRTAPRAPPPPLIRPATMTRPVQLLARLAPGTVLPPGTVKIRGPRPKLSPGPGPGSPVSGPGSRTVVVKGLDTRCGECAACHHPGCLACVYCRSGDPALMPLCSQRRCLNPIKKRGRKKEKKVSVPVESLPQILDSPDVSIESNSGASTRTEMAVNTSIVSQEEDFHGFPSPQTPQTPTASIGGDIDMSPLISTPKTKKPKVKSVKCGTCEACTRTDPCGDCAFCKSDSERGKFLCLAKRCKNKIVTGEVTPKVKEKKEKDDGTPKEPKKKFKRNKCGNCTGCSATACGECGACQSGRSWLCHLLRCHTPLLTEVLPKTPKTPKESPKPSVNVRKRCGECEGCAAAPCGDCEECTTGVPDKCKDRECLNPIKSRASKSAKKDNRWTPQVKEMIAKTGTNTNPKRYQRCRECEGCKTPDCGKCKSCMLYEKHKDKVRDPVTCEKLVCSNPISLYGQRVEIGGGDWKCNCESCNGDPPVMCESARVKKAIKSGRHEDGCCPLKEIQGNVYDFRCYFCKVLPRVGSANRSELYRHYSVYHYAAELKMEFGHGPRCIHCKAVQKAGSFVSHMGQVHNEVEKYLPDVAKIPGFCQGKGGGRRRRNNAPIVSKRRTNWIFPEVPEDYDPRGEQREIVPPQPETPAVEIDGFNISYEEDEDEEPLFVTREDPVTMPDYDGKSGMCCLCKSTFADIMDAVLHIHARHGILGGSQHIMLDADRLLKGGYLSIPIDSVDTVITERGRGDFVLDDEDEGLEVVAEEVLAEDTDVKDLKQNLVSHLLQQNSLDKTNVNKQQEICA